MAFYVIYKIVESKGGHEIEIPKGYAMSIDRVAKKMITMELKNLNHSKLSKYVTKETWK